MRGPAPTALAYLATTAVLLLALAGPARGQDAEPGMLTVGTKESPPFSLRDADGRWTGITVELWREIASALDLRFRFVERDVPGLVSGLEDGSLDASVAALTMTAERERRIDFSHPFHTTGLAIAVSGRPESAWITVSSRFLSLDFARILGVMVALLLGAGLLVWAFERKRNSEQFGGTTAQGIGSGFWWSAVTMTTVGHGDKAPRTLGGRLIGLLWMFACVITISGLTAAIASTLTVTRLESAVSGPGDLPRVRVATVGGTTSEQALRARGISARALGSPAEALRALASNEVDAVVYDAPILRYLVSRDPGLGVTVRPGTFDVQHYAIGLPDGSPLREPMNRVLLEKTSGSWWRELLTRYLGAVR